MVGRPAWCLIHSEKKVSTLSSSPRSRDPWIFKFYDPKFSRIIIIKPWTTRADGLRNRKNHWIFPKYVNKLVPIWSRLEVPSWSRVFTKFRVKSRDQVGTRENKVKLKLVPTWSRLLTRDLKKVGTWSGPRFGTRDLICPGLHVTRQ